MPGWFCTQSHPASSCLDLGPHVAPTILLVLVQFLAAGPVGEPTRGVPAAAGRGAGAERPGGDSTLPAHSQQPPPPRRCSTCAGALCIAAPLAREAHQVPVGITSMTVLFQVCFPRYGFSSQYFPALGRGQKDRRGSKPGACGHCIAACGRRALAIAAQAMPHLARAAAAAPLF